MRLSRARPLWPVLGVNEFSAEAGLELLGVSAVGEAEDEHVRVIAPEGVRPRTQRESFAEETDGHVVVAGAASGGERHLVRPLPIHRAFAQLPFAVDQGASGVGRRPRSMRRRGDSSLRAA